MKLNQECQCVRLCVRLRDVHVCVCSPSGSFRLLLMRGTYRDKGVPPPTHPHPTVQPNPSAASSFCTHTHTHTICHSHTPSHLNLTRKTPHIRPIVETALFLNPSTHHHHPEEKIYNTITVSALLVTASILILKDG